MASGSFRRARCSGAPAGLCHVRRNAYRRLDRVEPRRIQRRKIHAAISAPRHGPEGQPCDFTALRVYTWGKQKERYETAFVESDVCGKFPILKSRAAGP